MPRSSKARTLAALDGLRDEVGGAADGHEVDGFESWMASIAAGPRSALPIMPRRPVSVEHLAGELVHAGRGGGAGGADDLVADGIDGADVVDEAALEIDGEFFAAVEHVGHALVRGVAAGEELAGEQKDLAGLPGANLVVGDGVEVDALRVVRRRRSSLGQASSDGGSSTTGPEPSRWTWAWRVAAQLGIMATGRLAAWVGKSRILTSRTVVRPPRPCAPMPSG